MMYGRGYYGYSNPMMGPDGGTFFAGLMIVVFIVLLIAGVVLLVMWAMRSQSGHAHMGAPTPPTGAQGHHEAIAIAKKRLASGEITREQYEEIIRTIGG